MLATEVTNSVKYDGAWLLIATTDSLVYQETQFETDALCNWYPV